MLSDTINLILSYVICSPSGVLWLILTSRSSAFDTPLSTSVPCRFDLASYTTARQRGLLTGIYRSHFTPCCTHSYRRQTQDTVTSRVSHCKALPQASSGTRLTTRIFRGIPSRSLYALYMSQYPLLTQHAINIEFICHYLINDRLERRCPDCRHI